jgi:hypothetical protein
LAVFRFPTIMIIGIILIIVGQVTNQSRTVLLVVGIILTMGAAIGNS